MNQRTNPTSPQANVTVMASAGTGKTWLLVTRLVRLLMEGISADAILAITFTRKAAAEMQTRLGERLLALAAADDMQLDNLLAQHALPSDEVTRQHARGLYETYLRSEHPLRTTTFHAFCQEILRRFPLDADVPPGFELLERSGDVQQAALEALVAEATAAPDGELATALEVLLGYCGGLFNLNTALSTFLSHRSDWWAFTEESNTPEGYAGKKLAQALEVDLATDPREAFFSARRIEELASFAALLGKHPTNTNLRHSEVLLAALSASQTSAPRFDLVLEVFLTQKGEPRSRKASATQAKKMGMDGEEQFLALHQSLSQALLATLDTLNRQQTLQGNLAWYRVGARLLEHYQRLKSEQRVLDFADLEWKAYRLLNHAGNAQWIQYKLDQRIDHLLVDEFQDTNPTQWRLLLPLLQELAASANERRRSVFLVGDTKQSIYRFRRAEPRLFDTAKNWLDENLAAETHILNHSWRSAPAIMDCVNRVFALAELQRLIPDFPIHATHHQGLWGRVTLMPLIRASEDETPETEAQLHPALRNPLHTPRVLSVDDRYLREGQAIAAEIHELIAQGTLIGSASEARALSYADILILVRSRNHVGAYEQALREAGIPYLGAERGTLLASQEIRDLVALLNTLLTPYDNLALATVLRSPLFACSNDDLVSLAGSTAARSWFERLLLLGSSAHPESPLGRATALLGSWHALAGHIPIHDLLDRIFAEGNLLARYRAAYPAHLQESASANLGRFIELALEIDHGRYPSLSRFLARLEEMSSSAQEAPDEAPAPGSEARVRIMTIHAAKGLEAPVVFLADAAASPRRDTPYRAQVRWPVDAPRPTDYLLIGRKGQRDPLTKALLEQESLAEERESANLLYVALTRSRQLLYLSAAQPGRGDDTGWYGLLRKALAEEDISQTEPLTLHSGTMPRQPGAVHTPIPLHNIPAPDPRLLQPFNPAPLTRELAPSQQATQLHGPGVDSDADARLRGVAIHRLLEWLSELPCEEHGGLPARLGAELGMEEGDVRLQEWWQEAQAVFQDPALQAYFHPAELISAHNEVPLSFHDKSADTAVYGIIDRLLICPQTIWIIDYKTHRTANSDAIAALAEGYRAQMQYYANGIRKLWPTHQLKAVLLFTYCRLPVSLELE